MCLLRERVSIFWLVDIFGFSSKGNLFTNWLFLVYLYFCTGEHFGFPSNTSCVVVNSDALAQANDIQIGRRQVVFLCWMQDLNQGPWNRICSRLNARWQTDWAIEHQAKTWTQQPVFMISEHSAHSTPLPFGFRTWLWRYTCLLLLLISMLWHKQAIFKSKGTKLSSSAECRIWTRVFVTESLADGIERQLTDRLSYRGSSKYTSIGTQ